MNQFMGDYLERLRQVSSDENVIELYHWFWDRQDEIRRSAEEINRELGLYGDYAVKPDLPCLTMGSRSGLLFLLVNPGWSKELNQKEDGYCRKSKKTYVDFFFNYFIRSPQVLGERIRYAVNMISFVGTLRDGLDRFGYFQTPEERWERAHSSRLLGHWELFPFHSASDGLNQHIGQYPWLSSCMKESLGAVMRLQPELLLVMSRYGWDMLRNEVLRDQQWRDIEIGKPATRLSYWVGSGKTRTTEIVAIPRQVLSSHRICTNQEFFNAVDKLRQTYSAALSGQSISAPLGMVITQPRVMRRVIRIPAAAKPLNLNIPTRGGAPMNESTLTGAFASYDAKLVNRMWAYSAIAADGSFVFSCWKNFLKRQPDGRLRYQDKLSDWSTNPLGKELFRRHLQQAFSGKLPVRLVIASPKDPARIAARKEARSVPKTFSVRKDLVGKVLAFDGDRFVIEF